MSNSIDPRSLSFPQGIPGFPLENSFALSKDLRSNCIFHLRSNTSELRFLLVAALTVDPRYELSLESRDQEILRLNPPLSSDEDLQAYFVVSMRLSSQPTINMLAPIVVRFSIGLGIQAVRSDQKYSHAAIIETGTSRREGYLC